ncbi:conserved hypothetical protein [Ixodes scapularis]|uniref:Uncharacterized protein n=1 Tax=Ixodes scapularis TaxID=6945 RepID=B7P6H5_IXOSC|nr:conserved hypothetical protein [Ixodes scapularis]|eukprot:XP_002408739.1 conserved hypothetical protein [Ixodes scapularis]
MTTKPDFPAQQPHLGTDEDQLDSNVMYNNHNGKNNNNHAPIINIDPGVDSGLLLRVPDLPLPRGSSSAESLNLTPTSSQRQFLNLPSSGSCEVRRHSMQDCCHDNHQNHHHHRKHRDRKRSCPDVRGSSSADRRRRGSRSPLAPGTFDSTSVTPVSSRRSSASSLSRRSSKDSESCAHSRRSSRCDDGSRRSSKCDESRRSSRATDDTTGTSSRRSSRSVDEDRRRESSIVDGTVVIKQHRKSSSLAGGSEANSRRASKVPALLVTDEETGQQQKPDDELDTPRRRIIIFVISSVACFILLMSVVLIAVTLTISPAIDSMGKLSGSLSAASRKRELFRTLNVVHEIDGRV